MKYLKIIGASIILIGALLIFHSVTNAQQEVLMNDLEGKWEILSEKSEFTFKARTLGLFTVKGTISGTAGTINFDKINSNEFIGFSLKPSSLNTGNDKRDEHLRSEDFLYVSEYPLIEFKGGKIELINSMDNTYEVTGMLTIRGVTHEEVIPVTIIGYYNGRKNIIEFEGALKIDRNKYEVDYTGRLISDDVKIKYTLTAEKK